MKCVLSCMWLLCAALACSSETKNPNTAQPIEPTPSTTNVPPSNAPMDAGMLGSGGAGIGATVGASGSAPVDDEPVDDNPRDPEPADPQPLDPQPLDPQPLDPRHAGAHCLDGITNYADKGPFAFEAKRSGSVKLWVPAVPAGCKVPVIHLANGTGASCSSYLAILEHLASHGFLVTCFENTNTAQGTQCIDAVETALTEYPDVADEQRLGFTGHEIGGSAAFTCVYRAEEKWGAAKIYAGHAIAPASATGASPADWMSLYAQVDSPMFMFNGSEDILVSATWVRDAFDALNDNAEAYWYTAVGATHIPIPATWTQQSAVAWFRWKLLGDKQACQSIKDMPAGNEWDLQASQNESDC